MFDEKYFSKNKELTKLYIDNREDLLNDKNVIQEIGNYFYLNSKSNKSRNYKRNLLDSEDEEKLPINNNTEKFVKTEFNEVKNNFNKEELRNILNNIIFNLSYNLNSNLNDFKNKINSSTINKVIMDGKNYFSMNELFQNLNNQTVISKKTHKFNIINTPNNKNKEITIKDNKEENIILNEYLSDSKVNSNIIKRKNIFKSKENYNIGENIIPLKKNYFHSSKKVEHINLQKNNMNDFKIKIKHNKNTYIIFS